MMNPVIAYPIKKDPTREEDLLLKYSLRSLEQNGGALSRLFMIGQRRWWFSDNVNMVDIESRNIGLSKFTNVGVKLRVFSEMNIPFVLMNDDFLINRQMQITRVKNYALPSIKKLIDHHRSNTYQSLLQRTIDLLNDGKDMEAFVTHTPMLIDRPDLMTVYDKKLLSTSFRQVYAIKRELSKDANTVIVDADVKIKNKYSINQWLDLMKTMETMSLHPSAIDKNLFGALELLYPDKSIYEI